MEGGALLKFDAYANSRANTSNDQGGFDKSTSCTPASKIVNLEVPGIGSYIYKCICRFNIATSISRALQVACLTLYSFLSLLQ